MLTRIAANKTYNFREYICFTDFDVIMTSHFQQRKAIGINISAFIIVLKLQLHISLMIHCNWKGWQTRH